MSDQFIIGNGECVGTCRQVVPRLALSAVGVCNCFLKPADTCICWLLLVAAWCAVLKKGVVAFPADLPAPHRCVQVQRHVLQQLVVCTRLPWWAAGCFLCMCSAMHPNRVTPQFCPASSASPTAFCCAWHTSLVTVHGACLGASDASPTLPCLQAPCVDRAPLAMAWTTWASALSVSAMPAAPACGGREPAYVRPPSVARHRCNAMAWYVRLKLGTT